MVAALGVALTMAPANAANVQISVQASSGPSFGAFCTPFVGPDVFFGFGSSFGPCLFGGFDAFGRFGPFGLGEGGTSVAVNTGAGGTQISVDTLAVGGPTFFGGGVFGERSDGGFIHDDVDRNGFDRHDGFERGDGGGSATAVNTAVGGTAVAIDSSRHGDATAVNTGIGGTAVAVDSGQSRWRDRDGGATAINTGIGGTAVAVGGGGGSDRRHDEGGSVAVNTGILGTAVATGGGTSVNTGILGTAVATGGGTAVNTGILGSAVAVGGGHSSAGLVNPFFG